MKFIEAKLKIGDEVYDDAGTDTQGKSKYINGSIPFIAVYISPRDFEIIFEHRFLLSIVPANAG